MYVNAMFINVIVIVHLFCIFLNQGKPLIVTGQWPSMAGVCVCVFVC